MTELSTGTHIICMHSRGFGLWFRSQGSILMQGLHRVPSSRPTQILQNRKKFRKQLLSYKRTRHHLIYALETIIRMLQIPNRQKNATAAPTKAVILVSFLTNRKENSSAYTLQVGGPSRGTRFRPLSLDVPKVSSRLSPDARTAMLKTLSSSRFSTWPATQ